MAISPYIKRLRERIGNDLLMIPGVTAIILDDQRRVLLQRSSDDGKWYTVGGAMDPGEVPAEAVVREVLEETGLRIEPIRVVAVLASSLITYPNGHQVRYVGTVFLCRLLGGELHVADDESLELRYFAVDELPELLPDQRQGILHALSGDPVPYFQKPR